MTDIASVKLKRDIAKIADHYGQTQFKKCVEELDELKEAIYLHIASGYSEETESHVNEEVADVEIMTAQLKMLMNSEDIVDGIKQFKVDRQLGRIERGE